MNYFEIADEPAAVVWEDDEGCSGVIREGLQGWDEFQNWLDAGNLLAPSEPADTRPLNELRAVAQDLVNEQADQVMDPVTRFYPQIERASWTAQCAEAIAWLANSQSPTPLLDAITGALSETDKRAFCAALHTKADDYKILVGRVIAWRRANTAWIEASTREQLFRFTPNYPELPHAS